MTLLQHQKGLIPLTHDVTPMLLAAQPVITKVEIQTSHTHP